MNISQLRNNLKSNTDLHHCLMGEYKLNTNVCFCNRL